MLNQITQTQHSITQQVECLKNSFSTGMTRPYSWRIDQLNQLLNMLTEQEADFLQALNNDLGKCEFEGWVSEIGYTVSDITHTIKQLKKWMKPRKVSTPMVIQPAKSYQLPEPLGTILIIGAWNYPIRLIIGPLIAAIAAGNCALVKPSELCPACSSLLAKLIPQYLNNKAYKVQQGGVDETTELLKHNFDHIMYTGGDAVGKIVMRAASEHLTPVTLELGGKNPCIIDASADLDSATSRIVWNKWMNAGQTCLSPDYILIEKSQADSFIKALISKLGSFYGNSVQTNSDYGRIVNTRHLNRLVACLTDQNVIHGGEYDLEGKFLAPTLVLNPDLDSSLMTEEIFGPILPIVTLDNIQQAIPFINHRPKPLAVYLYGNNRAFEQQLLSNTSSGNVCINDGMIFMANPNLPFGGVGKSGMGKYHGQAGFDNFSHLKTVMKRSTWIDPALRYPPFSKMKLSMIKKLL
jgi:aldehyde dehydrogenase (NAD+)